MYINRLIVALRDALFWTWLAAPRSPSDQNVTDPFFLNFIGISFDIFLLLLVNSFFSSVHQQSANFWLIYWFIADFDLMSKDYHSYAYTYP